MNHKFCIFDKYSSEKDLCLMEKLVCLDCPILLTLREYVMNLLELGTWCYIYDDYSNIGITECNLEINVDEIHIYNVYVNSKFRNNNYCKLLLLNIIYNFGKKIYKIESYLNNKSAYFCYRGIFGDPYDIEDELVYFSLDLR